MKNNFTDNCKELLNSIPDCTGDMARLAHRLSRAINRIETITSQAQAQFNAGDSHATFSKQTIQSIISEENGDV